MKFARRLDIPCSGDEKRRKCNFIWKIFRAVGRLALRIKSGCRKESRGWSWRSREGGLDRMQGLAPSAALHCLQLRVGLGVSFPWVPGRSPFSLMRWWGHTECVELSLMELGGNLCSVSASARVKLNRWDVPGCAGEAARWDWAGSVEWPRSTHFSPCFSTSCPPVESWRERLSVNLSWWLKGLLRPGYLFVEQC